MNKEDTCKLKLQIIINRAELQELRGLQNVEAIDLIWEYILQEIVDVSYNDTHQIYPYCVSDEYRKSQQDPR